jgi:flagellin
MPQFINTNVASLNTQRSLNTSQNALQVSLQRLSSGLRINSAKDDAAGLAISERFTTQIRGINQAIRNANDGVSFAQTAEGALSTAGDSLQRIRELAVQSINDTNSSSDRAAINSEVSALIAEVNRISSATQFNGQNILDGSLSELTFQVGANQNQTIQVDGVDARTSQLGARISTSASIDNTALAASIAANDIVINGNSVDLTGDTTTTDVIASINAVSSSSGVEALKATTVSTLSAGLQATAAAATVNGVQVGTMVAFATVGSGATNIAAINAVSTQTGVTASAGTGEGVVLSNTDGSAIATTGGLGAETYNAGIILAGGVADGAYTASGTFAVEVMTVAAGLGATANQVDNTLSGVDVLTSSSANDALLTLDFALQQVTGLRAELGAVQSRFESTIANLATGVENLSSARSRIRDADFASETAELTRNQIIQQAGIAMLSQANSAPQNVLALLQ